MPSQCSSSGRHSLKSRRVDSGRTISKRLYYRPRLIYIPPLRERPEDIPLLACHFVKDFARRMNKTIDAISSKTMDAQTRYPWRETLANYRTSLNVIERSVILCESEDFSVDDLSPGADVNFDFLFEPSVRTI